MLVDVMEWQFDRRWMQPLAVTVHSLSGNSDRHSSLIFASTQTNHQQTNLRYISRQNHLEPAGKTAFESAGVTP
jgi:hypothetical protein